MKIGFIGTGLMGRPMAGRLIDAGHEVTVFNRTRAKALALAEKGARVADAPAAAIAAGQTVITMLSDAQAVRDTLLNEDAKAALKGRAVLQMSTIGPEESKEIMAAVTAAGGEYLESPVLGSTPQAVAGTLILMVGAEPGQFERFTPLLKTFGPEPVLAGKVGDGAAMKLAMNQLIASSLSAFAFALAYVQARGLDPDAFMKVLRGSALYAKMFEGKLPRMVERNYDDPHFPVKHLKKDVGLVIDEGRRQGLETPVLQGVIKLLDKSMDKGFADGDYAAIFEAVKGNS